MNTCAHSTLVQQKPERRVGNLSSHAACCCLRISGEKWPHHHPSVSLAPIYSRSFLIWGRMERFPRQPWLRTPRLEAQAMGGMEGYSWTCMWLLPRPLFGWNTGKRNRWVKKRLGACSEGDCFVTLVRCSLLGECRMELVGPCLFLALSEENCQMKWPTMQILPLYSGLCGPLRGCTESQFKAWKRVHLVLIFWKGS